MHSELNGGRRGLPLEGVWPYMPHAGLHCFAVNVADAPAAERPQGRASSTQRRPVVQPVTCNLIQRLTQAEIGRLEQRSAK